MPVRSDQSLTALQFGLIPLGICRVVEYQCRIPSAIRCALYLRLGPEVMMTAATASGGRCSSNNKQLPEQQHKNLSKAFNLNALSPSSMPRYPRIHDDVFAADVFFFISNLPERSSRRLKPNLAYPAESTQQARTHTHQEVLCNDKCHVEGMAPFETPQTAGSLPWRTRREALRSPGVRMP